MKLDIEINEDEIVRLAVDKIAENLVKKYTAESRTLEKKKRRIMTNDEAIF